MTQPPVPPPPGGYGAQAPVPSAGGPFYVSVLGQEQGPLDFNGNGEPLRGQYAVLEFGADNRLTDEETLVTAESPESSIVERDDGMIEPTIFGCSRKPWKNTPAGPRAWVTRRISFPLRRSSASSLPFMGRNAPFCCAGADHAPADMRRDWQISPANASATVRAPASPGLRLRRLPGQSPGRAQR